MIVIGNPHNIGIEGFIDIFSEEVKLQIDNLGDLSGVAQKLNGPLTSMNKLKQSNFDWKLYVHISDSSSPQVFGILKFGVKTLFFYDKSGNAVEIKNCGCVLDFYVSESVQRQGIGYLLFDHMLKDLAVDPVQLAYDRPSPKLLAFLKKYYYLSEPNTQPNKFVIFEGFKLL